MTDQITTAAELDALPVGSVWTDAYDNIGFRQEPGYLVPTGTWLDSLDKRSPTKWLTAAEIIAETARYGALPLTVLYRPDRPAQPTVQPSERDLIVALHREWDRLPGEDVCECDLIDIAEIGDLDLLTRQAQAVLALIGGRTEAEAVKGVQQWMALDLHMALGHGVEPPADAEHDWADWWARMLAEVRERRTEAEVKAEALEEAAEEFASRLPDGTGNGRAYNSWRVAELLRARAAAIRGEQ